MAIIRSSKGEEDSKPGYICTHTWNIKVREIFFKILMWIEKWQIEVDHEGTIQMPMGKKIIGIPHTQKKNKWW